MIISDAVKKFREAAIAKGDFAVPAHRDHLLHSTMSEAWSYLETQGAEGHAAFSALTSDESAHVRLWVASQLLSQGEEGAARVVEAEAASGSSLALDAKIVLQEWRAGRLSSPFRARVGGLADRNFGVG